MDSKKARETPGKRPGRPTKQTDERVAILLEALESGLPFDIACDYAKLHEATVYRWMKEDENLAIQVSFAKSKAQMGVVAELKKKDPKYWLQKRDAKNWAEEKQSDSFQIVVNVPDSGKEEL